jgi:hypothetical protein
MSLVRRLTAGTRWGEYASLLSEAKANGYRLVSLEEWVRSGCDRESLTFVLRHDVDQIPEAARKMAGIENALEVRSTWYFRWRTARRDILDDLREAGHSVGVQFETLSRAAREGEVAQEDLSAKATIKRFRPALRGELAAFEAAFGPVSTIAAHGDTRVREANNRRLSRRLSPERWGDRFDGDEAVREAKLALKVTDRARPYTWSGGGDPFTAVASGTSPILCLTHPNNWTAGFTRAFDRGIRVPLRTGVARVRAGSRRVSVDSPNPPHDSIGASQRHKA